MRQRDRISLAVGGAALACSVLALGGVFRWTQAVVALLVAGALSSQVASRRRLDRLSPILVLIGIAIVVTAIQLIPLPQSMLDAFNSTGNGLRNDSATLSGTEPWPCLSMDPAGTLRALTFFITLFGVALLSLRVAASENGRFWLIGGVALVCGLAAMVAGLHKLTAANSYFGLYTPAHVVEVLGPLLNPNHFGCLMAFGATISIGLAFHDKQHTTLRAAWVAIAILCAVMTLVSESRGAAISLALGTALTSAVLIGRGFGRGDSARDGRIFKQVPIAFVLMVGLGLAVFMTAGDVADQLDRTSLTEVERPASKFAAWRASTHLVADAPWFGVGRGAIEPTFTRVFEPSSFVTFSHLENEYVSAVVEWGIPAAIAFAIVLAWCIVGAIRRWHGGPLAAAALGGMVGVMFQSAVDFGIQMIGLAIPVTIVACTLQMVPLRETSRSFGLRLHRLLVIAVIVGSAVLVMLPMSRGLQEDHDELLAGDPDVLTIKQVLERHPLDYLAVAKLADKLIDSKDQRAVAMLNHALSLHPSHPGLHRFAGRLLVGSNRKEQAAVEYSLAIKGTIRPHTLLAEILVMLPDPSEAAKAIPVDYSGPEKILASLSQFEREDVSIQWLLRVLETSSPDLAMIDKLYELAMRKSQLEIAQRAATTRLKTSRTTTSRLMLARVELARGNLDAVQNELADVQQWSGRIDERAEGWMLVCDTYKQRKQWDPALECLHRLDASGLLTVRGDLVKKEQEIADERTRDAKLKQIQDLERRLNLPIDIDIPVTRGTPEPKPSAIPSPIKNPLLRPQKK